MAFECGAGRDDAHDASIVVSGRCGLRADDAPLEALTNHLLIGTTERVPLQEETRPFDAREARFTSVTAKLDGVVMRYEVVVLKMNPVNAAVGPHLEKAFKCLVDEGFLAIGERCNANGSKKFRDLQAAGDWDGCIAMGREQVREGSNALDVCTAFVGRDEIAEMNAVVERMRGQVDSPLVIDSTELPVLEQFVRLNAMGWHTFLDMVAAAVRGGPVEGRDTYMKTNARRYNVDLANPLG